MPTYVALELDESSMSNIEIAEKLNNFCQRMIEEKSDELSFNTVKLVTSHNIVDTHIVRYIFEVT